MSLAQRRWAADLLHFWFHELGPGDWFAINPVVDDELRRRFEARLSAFRNRPARDFLTDPRTAQAAVLLFDQCTRNIYRDNARSFAFDRLARAITRVAISRRWDRALPMRERHFFYMPLMHSEHIADQLLCLCKFSELNSPLLTGFARAHYRMIARFGRFPHRNDVLGRESTPAEQRAVASGFAW